MGARRMPERGGARQARERGRLVGSIEDGDEDGEEMRHEKEY